MGRAFCIFVPIRPATPLRYAHPAGYLPALILRAGFIISISTEKTLTLYSVILFGWVLRISNKGRTFVLSDNNKEKVMTTISISALEKMVRKFAESTGFEYTIDVFQSGHYSDSRPSYVDLTIEGNKSVMVRILANGYGNTDKFYISTDRGWKVAKAEIIKRMN